MPEDRECLTVRLRDGRTVAYAQYGAPDGVVIVNAHGGLACGSMSLRPTMPRARPVFG